MGNWAFTQGIHDLGKGLYGYVQPDGTWGWSNAGLIISDGESMLVDTLVSLPLTRTMLEDFKRRVPGAEHIDTVVNTHANPDHFFGNQLLSDARIIGTETAARDMSRFDPASLANLREHHAEMGEGGEFLYETMGRRFDFEGIVVTPPNQTFQKSLALDIGGKRVELTDLGPAHTASDTIVHIPEDRVVFTGDLLFNEGHPIMWSGPVENWIAACDHILALDVDVVVPGHGPITDKQSVRNLRSYFTYVRERARELFEAGVDFEEAALKINLDEFRGWSDPERIVANVYSLYRQWGAEFPRAQRGALFGAMKRYQVAMASHEEHCGHEH
ncbi:MBL fold metallo-hydrolase [Aurantiacibacter gilvus]|uniref:MBL fold metallo-hydrolase n=1 Tax=Aurantiacibacter gilvus TaxID=3139141 RepID=A0ABU9IG28_9SPHN